MFSKFGTTEIEILEVKYVGEVEDKWEKIRFSCCPTMFTLVVVLAATRMWLLVRSRKQKVFPCYGENFNKLIF